MWNRYKSVNEYSFKMDFGIDPWQEDPYSAHYKAAAAAIQSVRLHLRERGRKFEFL